MKTLTKLIPVALLALSSSIHAQEPVVGVANPESLFVDEDPLLHKNKQATLHIMRELLQCNQWDRAREWMTEQYIQHNPNAASGVEGVVYYFTQVLKREPTENCGELKTPVVAVMAEDDLVTVMMPRTYPHPNKEGETYTTTWYDTFRFVDGKADEHWDPATIPAP
ncbi:nuclear transport factor 2 family protein [Marinobacterium mangrovicola]|uniref:Putative SnoaL-like aldol condensation-catalyzing enzyme n=1 Tax=Marinobacterium mangrovicola TaxID=1476959 RepID=A0A4R1GR62_9GAMM|nr:nuclear transport factor 2 family protein [Marinobacterium mangrovicola]TCK08669.1 putative SnoaL-like aldol condensation-catalyzing enzyme [Marinobacterium mangrovicola]